MLTPYYYQNEAVDSIFFYYASGKTGNPLVAMPTASGKGVVIAEFCKRVLQRWPRQRIILATHVKELIEQNEEKLLMQWPNAPIGLYSSGLKRRDTNFPLIYGGIQSIVGNVTAFGYRDLLLIDEAHLLSPKENTEYQQVIKELKQINPHMKVIGFTATPYRLGQGMLTDGGIFTDICYDLTSYENFNRLIAEGYLCTLIPKRTHVELDTSRVKITAGEFNQGELQEAVDVDKITLAACREMAEEGYDRKCWLVFSSGIVHAEHIASVLQSLGIDAAAIHSKMPADLCTARLKAFRAGKLRCLVNYGKATTGVDVPAIDLIGMLRPTFSTVLWVQMLGRGTRMSPATRKENCLVLDFAKNTPRLGPVNDPIIPKKRVKGVPGVAPIRLCPQCGVYNHARATHCLNCGFEFPAHSKLYTSAGTEALIRTDAPVMGEFDVTRIFYHRDQKPGSPPMIRVQYICGIRSFSEYLCFEHPYKTARTKAVNWWRQRTGSPMAPPTVEEALKYIKDLPVPKRIKVQLNKKYPEVLACEY